MRLEDMLADDAILPSQFAALFGSKIESGERRLYLAILQDALRCLSHSKLGDAAKKWIYDQDDNSPLVTFTACCQALDIDPDYLRRILRERKMARGIPQLSHHAREKRIGL